MKAVIGIGTNMGDRYDNIRLQVGSNHLQPVRPVIAVLVLVALRRFLILLGVKRKRPCIATGS